MQRDNQESNDDQQMVQRKERIRLPFENEPFDLFVWSYDHRYGVAVLIIFYLIVAIAFVSARFVIEKRELLNRMEIEVPENIELEQQRDELQKSLEQLQQQQEIDWESIRNELSNEESMDEEMRELIESGEAYEQIMDALAEDMSAQEFMANQELQRAEMQRNRSAYEAGLAELERERERMLQNNSSGEVQERRDTNKGGGVTASYSFTHPVRHAQKFIIPAYKCMGGGEVRIAVLLSRDGRVIAAEHLMGGDDCMRQHAVESALQSTFNVSPSAPNPHRGTITYFYIPQ